MTEEFRELLLRDWARDAATVVLTRRDDLTVLDAGREPGLDLRVVLDRQEEWTTTSFGILTRAVPFPITTTQANKRLKPTMKEFWRLGGVNYPVCLLFFTMEANQEFLSWVNEPTILNGDRQLVSHDAPRFLTVTKELMDAVVDRVVAWYDAAEALI